MPAVAPVTTPVVLILATAALLLLHTPPVVASVRVEVAPMHIVVVPLMAATLGEGLTVIVAVAVAVPHALVTL